MGGLISIVTPVFNEEENLPELTERVFGVADKMYPQGYQVEVVIVDDCSHDDTQRIAEQLVQGQRHVKYLRFARNAGSHAALSAGLQMCNGECAILMAADLQDPPELLPQFVEQWEDGNDVVWAIRGERKGETIRTRLFARFYYWVMRKAALPNMPAAGADFVLLDRKVIDAYNNIGEKNTSIMGMLLWMGFRQSSFEYVKEARGAGRSGWSLSKKVKLFVDSIVSFSYLPIRLMSTIGMLMAVCGFLYAVFVVIGRLSGWMAPGSEGFAALMTVVLVTQGTIMITLGVLGEYVWRSYDETRGRPRYIVQEYVESESCRRSPRKIPAANPRSKVSKHIRQVEERMREENL